MFNAVVYSRVAVFPGHEDAWLTCRVTTSCDQDFHLADHDTLGELLNAVNRHLTEAHGYKS